MTKSYKEITTLVNGDLNNLERAITTDVLFPNNALEELLLAPAKRIRAVLAFLFLRAKGLNITDTHYNYQAAIELAHTASLIHDDIVDFNNIRRGNPTLNCRYGDKIGVLTGDYLLSVSLSKIINNPIVLKKFLEIFSQMAQGEIIQHFQREKIPTIDDYIQKTVQKTAGLFSLALFDIAEEFGLNFGIAFQIKNDLKDINEDIKNGIYTAPVIYSNSIQITDEGIQKTKDLVNYYLEKAQKLVDELPKNEYSVALYELLELYKEC